MDFILFSHCSTFLSCWVYETPQTLSSAPSQPHPLEYILLHQVSEQLHTAHTYTHLSRLGAHTIARFRACMLVWALNEAMWTKCLIRNSSVLQKSRTESPKRTSRQGWADLRAGRASKAGAVGRAGVGVSLEYRGRNPTHL